MSNEQPMQQAHHWWDKITPWLERGTPVTLLVLLALGGLTLWFQREEVARLHASQSELVRLLLEEKDKEIALALRIGTCEGKGSRGEVPPASPPIPTLDPVPWEVRTWQCAAF